MEGVSLEAGLCTSRRGMEETDLAYKIEKKIQLSAPTKQLFPGSEIYSYETTQSIASSPMYQLEDSQKWQKSLKYVPSVRDSSLC